MSGAPALPMDLRQI